MAATRAASKRSVEDDGSHSREKAKALDLTLKELNSKFGSGSITRMKDAKSLKIDRVPTGALTLDVALGGGFPRGRIVEIYGPESSGKTTLALQAVASVQQSGGNAAFIDAEHAFDPDYAERAGVDVKDLVFCQPPSGETALEIVDNLVRSAAVDIIAIDSVAALTPKAEIEGEIGDTFVGTQARMMSRALGKLSANAGKFGTTIIFINQLRQKIGVMYGNPETTTGGQALKYYSSVRLDVRKIKSIDGPGGTGDHIGVRVKAKVVKNKVAPPFRVCEFDILFGSGISKLGSLVDAAEKQGIIQRKGSWYYFGEQRLEQGREKTLANLKEDPQLTSTIETLTKKALLAEYGDKAAEEAEPEEEDALPLEAETSTEERGVLTA